MRNSFFCVSLFHLINDESADSRVDISYISNKLVIQRLPRTIWPIFSFLVSHTLLLFFLPKISWNKSKKYEQLGKYWSCCTRKCAITSGYYVHATLMSFPIDQWVCNDRHVDSGSINLVCDWKNQSAETENQNVLYLTHVFNDFTSRSTQLKIDKFVIIQNQLLNQLFSSVCLFWKYS